MISTGLPSSWRPILDGAQAYQAYEVLNIIANELRKPSPRASSKAAQSRASQISRDIQEVSLAGGKVGLALFYAYLKHARPEGDGDDSALEFLEEAIAALNEMPMAPSLFGGFTGIAWVLAHLEDRLLDLSDDDPYEAIDKAINHYLKITPWLDDYDLIRGLVGFGVYAIERLPDPRAFECLESIVERLDESSQQHSNGITWWTAPELLSDNSRKDYPGGWYNMGVAHGVPGVIGLLGQVCERRVSLSKASLLLEGAVSWLLSQKLPDGCVSRFPYNIAPEGNSTPSRLGWCYGDAGIAATLLYAARSVNEANWEREAIDIASRAARRAIDEASVTDAGLCHGASGLGHLFNRIYQATGDELFKQAALYWYERTFEMRRSDQGVAGFRTIITRDNGEVVWLDDPGFLSGAAGIGLSLIAATTCVEPEWDRLLLVSTPPKPLQ